MKIVSSKTNIYQQLVIDLKKKPFRIFKQRKYYIILDGKFTILMNNNHYGNMISIKNNLYKEISFILNRSFRLHVYSN